MTTPRAATKNPQTTVYVHVDDCPQVDIMHGTNGEPFGVIRFGPIDNGITVFVRNLESFGNLASHIEAILQDHNDPHRNEHGQLMEGDKDAEGSNQEDLNNVEAA